MKQKIETFLSLGKTGRIRMLVTVPIELPSKV